MKVALFGSNGMLGNEVNNLLRGHEVAAPRHNDVPIESKSMVLDFIGTFRPEVVINCAGVIDKSVDFNTMYDTNAFGPKNIASACGKYRAKFFHISTDCVFDGKAHSSYTIASNTEAFDVYGTTKAAGEKLVGFEWCSTIIRTSFIGYRHGLLRWMLDECESGAKEIIGWKNAYWSGSTVYEVARGILEIVNTYPNPHIIHLATLEATNKYEALKFLCQKFCPEMEAIPITFPFINRALETTHPIRSIYDEEIIEELISKQVAV